MQLTKHWAGQLDDYVIDLAWSPDGTQLAAASAAGPITLFATTDGAKVHELPGHDNGTNVLAWLPGTGDGRQVTGDRSQGSGDGGQGTVVHGEAAAVAGEASSADTRAQRAVAAILASGGQDGAVKFWDATAGQHTATAKLGSAWVEFLAWREIPSTARQNSPQLQSPSSPTGPSPVSRLPSPVPRPLSPVPSPLSPVLFAAAGRNVSAVRPDGSVAHTFKPAPKTITVLAMQPAGGSVAAAYFGGVVLWDTDDFIAQKEFPYANGIHALVWSPDSRWLVSGNQDPSVHLWIPEEEVELHMSGYEGKVKYLSFDPTSRWLATSGGREACIWDCAGAGPEGREPAMLPHDAPVCAVKFQNTHGLLATAAKDGVVHLWSPERRQPLRATVKMPMAATKLAWSPDDRFLAIGSEKGIVYVLKCDA